VLVARDQALDPADSHVAPATGDLVDPVGDPRVIDEHVTRIGFHRAFGAHDVDHQLPALVGIGWLQENREGYVGAQEPVRHRLNGRVHVVRVAHPGAVPAEGHRRHHVGQGVRLQDLAAHDRL
jgi:hypothetical protein